MTERPEFDLLADIAKLLRKHGPDVFANLARELADDSFRSQLVSLLDSAARIGRTVPTGQRHAPSKEKSSPAYESVLLPFQKADPEKFRLLEEFAKSFLTHRILSGIRGIRTFLSDQGLPPINPKSRQNALVPLVKLLSKLPNDRLKRTLAAIETTRERNDRSLEGWTNVILGQQRESGPTAEENGQ